MLLERGFVLLLKSLQAFEFPGSGASNATSEDPGIWALLAALLLVLVVVLLSAYLRLSLHKATIIAALR